VTTTTVKFDVPVVKDGNATMRNAAALLLSFVEIARQDRGNVHGYITDHLHNFLDRAIARFSDRGVAPLALAHLAGPLPGSA
jgi:hypothetical protein